MTKSVGEELAADAPCPFSLQVLRVGLLGLAHSDDDATVRKRLRWLSSSS